MNEDKEMELILTNLGLVLSQSSTFRETAYIDKNDYKQAGMVGLLKAIRKLDPTKASLATFSYRTIKNELLLEYRKNKRNLANLGESDLNVPASEPSSFNEYLPEMTDINKKIIQRKLEGYTISEIAVVLELSQQEIKNRLKQIYKDIKEANE
jgi:RNA polymerase sigma factor (sigma-70 family)